MSEPDTDALLERAEATWGWRAWPRSLAGYDRALEELLEQSVEGRLDRGFTALAVAALQAGRPVAAPPLECGCALLPDIDYLTAIAPHPGATRY